MIRDMIAAGRQEWEKDTHSVTLPTEITEQMKCVEQEHRLSLRPVQSITSVTVNGEELDPSTYELVKGRHVVELPSSYSGPKWSTVEIVYMAGYDRIPEIDKQAVLLLVELAFLPSYMVPKHRETYEHLVRKRMRSTYP